MTEPADPPLLADGRYPVIVVDTAGTGGDDTEEATMQIDVVVTAGPSRGEIVTLDTNLVNPGHRLDPDRLTASLLGLPGDLIVTDGRPRLELDEG